MFILSCWAAGLDWCFSKIALVLVLSNGSETVLHIASLRLWKCTPLGRLRHHQNLSFLSLFVLTLIFHEEDFYIYLLPICECPARLYHAFQWDERSRPSGEGFFFPSPLRTPLLTSHFPEPNTSCSTCPFTPPPHEIWGSLKVWITHQHGSLRSVPWHYPDFPFIIKDLCYHMPQIRFRVFPNRKKEENDQLSNKYTTFTQPVRMNVGNFVFAKLRTTIISLLFIINVLYHKYFCLYF